MSLINIICSICFNLIQILPVLTSNNKKLRKLSYDSTISFLLQGEYYSYFEFNPFLSRNYKYKYIIISDNFSPKNI